MNRRARLGAVLLLLQFQLAGQERDMRFSGDYRDQPFEDFAEAVSRQTGVSFYYREEWIRGIRVTASGEKLSLRRTLKRVLLPVGIDFYMDRRENIILTDRLPLVTQLPDYRTDRGTPADRSEEEVTGSMTRTERKYVEGRRAGMLETIAVGSSEAANGQSSAVVYGKITDAETGEPLIGATIYLEELKKGAVTDADGRFTIVVPPGRYTAGFDCMGMEGRRSYLDVQSGGSLSMELEKSLIPITEVVIKASRFHNVKGTQMGFDRLNYQVLKEIPVVMGEKDVLKVIRMLPGVQSVGEGAAGFNVRGSAADQNMIYVNKVPVYNSSHLFGFFTSFSPDIIRDFTLYKSNVPASYGGRLASFFNISTRQGHQNKYTARGGISPVTGHISVEGPIRKNRSAFVLSGRTTYSDWLLTRMDDPELRNSRAAFNDLSGVLTWEPGERTLVKAFGYRSRDRFRLASSGRYGYTNAGTSLNIRHRFSERTTGNAAMVYSQYDFGNTDLGLAAASYSHAYRISHGELRADMTWISLGKHRLTYGGNLIYYNLDRGIVEPAGENSLRNRLNLGTENGLEPALYLADEINLLPNLTLYAGLRYSGFIALGPDRVLQYGTGQSLEEGNVTDTLVYGPSEIVETYGGLEPRVSLNYLVGENHSLKFSYNRIRQYLFMLSNTIAISPTDQWKLSDRYIKPPFVDQVSLGYYLDLAGSDLVTSLELYHKWISNVLEYKDGASFIHSPHIETETLQGDQVAYGLEVMIRKNAGKLNGWLAYSYARSFMHMDSPVPWERINGGDPYRSNYDRPHNLNLVVNHKVNRRLSLSANLVYITGRPVTYPVSIYYVDGMQFLDYSRRNSYRIPDYFRFDFSINLEGNLKERKLFHSYWMLNFYNLTGRSNAYSVYFTNENGTVNGYKLSIFSRPIVTLSWNFKLGNYASE